MNREYEKHSVTSLQEEVTNRPPMYAASLWQSIHRGAAFVKFRGTAALDKSRGGVIIGDERGTLRQAVDPVA